MMASLYGKTDNKVIHVDPKCFRPIKSCDKRHPPPGGLSLSTFNIES